MTSADMAVAAVIIRVAVNRFCRTHRFAPIDRRLTAEDRADVTQDCWVECALAIDRFTPRGGHGDRGAELGAYLMCVCTRVVARRAWYNHQRPYVVKHVAAYAMRLWGSVDQPRRAQQLRHVATALDAILGGMEQEERTVAEQAITAAVNGDPVGPRGTSYVRRNAPPVVLRRVRNALRAAVGGVDE